MTLTDQIRDFILATYPAIYTPSDMAELLNMKPKTVQKALSRLLNDDMIQRPARMKKDYYQGKPGIHNLGNFEEPPVEIHCLTFQVENEEPYTPLLLNTHADSDTSDVPFRNIQWKNNDLVREVHFQFNPNHTMTIHLNSSKNPLDELEFREFMNWLMGMVQAFGITINNGYEDIKIVKAELSRDYRLVTITPKSLLIRDLLDKSWFRIYQKYVNLTRVEVGTTWYGEKKLYEMFQDFGKSRGPKGQQSDPGDMFG